MCSSLFKQTSRGERRWNSQLTTLARDSLAGHEKQKKERSGLIDELFNSTNSIRIHEHNENNKKLSLTSGSPSGLGQPWLDCSSKRWLFFTSFVSMDLTLRALGMHRHESFWEDEKSISGIEHKTGSVTSLLAHNNVNASSTIGISTHLRNRNIDERLDALTALLLYVFQGQQSWDHCLTIANGIPLRDAENNSSFIIICGFNWDDTNHNQILAVSTNCRVMIPDVNRQRPRSSHHMMFCNEEKNSTTFERSC